MLDEAAEGISCWEVVHDPKTAGEMDAETLLEMMKTAGYSEFVSQKVASQRAWERMKRDLKP